MIRPPSSAPCNGPAAAVQAHPPNIHSFPVRMCTGTVLHRIASVAIEGVDEIPPVVRKQMDAAVRQPPGLFASSPYRRW